MLTENKKYKYLLFDLDGTLTDPFESIAGCVQYALSKYGINEKKENLKHFIGPPLYDSFPEFYGFSEEQTLEAVRYFREKFAEIGIIGNTLYDGMDSLLRELKAAGKHLAVATSKPRVSAVGVTKYLGIESYFDYIVGSELDGRLSNKWEVVAECLRLFGVEEKREDVLMIGDRKHDIIGGKRNNVDTLGVEFLYSVKGEFDEAGATYKASTVRELRGFLLSH